MKRMRKCRALAALALAVSMLMSCAVAGTYDINEGSVYVHATTEDQTVKHGEKEPVSDREPIITSTKSENTNTVIIDADAGATAEMTFDNLNIDVSVTNGAAAVETTGDGNVEIELDGDSTLKSGDGAAGLQKENTGTLTIQDEDEDGSLTATGGTGGAGIGGGAGSNGSDIQISGGTVETQGGANAAGIGGGHTGDGTNIIISDGTVTATGGNGGAGIGGGGIDQSTGQGGDGNEITIEGGTVISQGGYYGAGIGGGVCGGGSDITISGGIVFVRGGESNGAGIGAGVDFAQGSLAPGTNSDNITVSGSAQVSIAGEDYGPSFTVDPDTSGLYCDGEIRDFISVDSFAYMQSDQHRPISTQHGTIHDIHDYPAQAPTCTGIGWDAYQACSRCDYTTNKEKNAWDTQRLLIKLWQPPARRSA